LYFYSFNIILWLFHKDIYTFDMEVLSYQYILISVYRDSYFYCVYIGIKLISYLYYFITDNINMVSIIHIDTIQNIMNN
jgi:hypothetical protein